MIWSEVRQAYPNRWLIIEAVEAHTPDEQRILDLIAVMEACDDNAAVMQAYERWHAAYPQRADNPVPKLAQFTRDHPKLAADKPALCARCHAESDCTECHVKHIHPGGAVGGKLPKGSGR